MSYFLMTTWKAYVPYMVRNTPVLELLYVASLPIGEMFFFLQGALKQICNSREKGKNIYEPLVDSKQ